MKNDAEIFMAFFCALMGILTGLMTWCIVYMLIHETYTTPLPFEVMKWTAAVGLGACSIGLFMVAGGFIFEIYRAAKPAKTPCKLRIVK